MTTKDSLDDDDSEITSAYERLIAGFRIAATVWLRTDTLRRNRERILRTASHIRQSD